MKLAGKDGNEVHDKTKYKIANSTSYKARFGHHFPNPHRSASTVVLFPFHKWDSGRAWLGRDFPE